MWDMNNKYAIKDGNTGQFLFHAVESIIPS